MIIDFLEANAHISTKFTDIFWAFMIMLVLYAVCWIFIDKIETDHNFTIEVKRFAKLWIFLGISFVGGVIIAGIALSEEYTENYSKSLYEHYSEYQYYISEVKDVSPYNKHKYLIFIDKNNTRYRLELNDETAEFEERLDPKSNESYYELHKNDATKKVILVRFKGLDEQNIAEKEKEIKKITIK